MSAYEKNLLGFPTQVDFTCAQLRALYFQCNSAQGPQFRTTKSDWKPYVLLKGNFSKEYFHIILKFLP